MERHPPPRGEVDSLERHPPPRGAVDQWKTWRRGCAPTGRAGAGRRLLLRLALLSLLATGLVVLLVLARPLARLRPAGARGGASTHLFHHGQQCSTDVTVQVVARVS
jgi:hypothetical protein